MFHFETEKNEAGFSIVTRHAILQVDKYPEVKESFKDTHILLAEDDLVNQFVAIEILEHRGCSVTPAVNGTEALRLFQRQSYDLMFMDCLMPKMDGFEATKNIRIFENEKNHSRTPIVAFTSKAMEGDREKCLNIGMDDYLTKPFNPDELFTMLKKWLPHKLQFNTSGDESSDKLDVSIGELNIVETNKFELIQSLPVLDDVPFQQLQKLFGVKFHRMVEKYRDGSQKNINNLQLAIGYHDSKLLEISAHSLKSTSQQIGAMRVGHIAERLEKYGVESDSINAAKLMPELSSEYNAAMSQIDSIIGENDSKAS